MRSCLSNSGVRLSLVLGFLLVGLPATCAEPTPQSKASAGAEFIPGFLPGYLATKELPNSLALLPPPPAAGSAALALDEELSRRSLALRDTPRWVLATSDADLHFPHAASTFSCALNAPITEVHTPRLYRLLRRTLTDFGLSTYAAKNHYNRPRPFLWNKAPICTPAEHKDEYDYYPKEWVSPYIERRRKVGWDLYGLLGIGKADRDRMAQQHQRNYTFFGAPVGLIFTVDRIMQQGSWLDYGMFLQSVMVAARARGLHTCPQAAFTQFHKVIAEELSLRPDQMVVCGMALGYADPSAIENTLVTDRAPVAEFAKFYGS